MTHNLALIHLRPLDKVTRRFNARDEKTACRLAARDLQREQLQRKCDYMDGEIDKLVYALYGLTAEKIKIVEGGSNKK